MSSLSLSLLLVLLSSAVPSALATCGFGYYNEYAGYPSYSGSSATVGAQLLYNSWTAANSASNQGSGSAPGALAATLNDTYCALCSSTVTLAFVVESQSDTIQVTMNGYVLTLTSQASCTPSVNPCPYVLGWSTTGTAATITSSTSYVLTAGSGSGQTFSRGTTTLCANGGGSSNHPTLYYIPFPYYNCGSTAQNRFQVKIVYPGVCTAYDYVNVNRYCPTTTPPPSTVHGDPEFTGLRGQDYQIHGIDGAVYNIISDQYMELNSRFIYLNGPRACPMIPSTGVKSVACWSHPGSYLGDLALKTNMGSKIYVSSGPAAEGFTAVELDGTAMTLGQTAPLLVNGVNMESGSVTYYSTHELIIKAGLFEIEIENSDEFLNLRSVLVRGKNWPLLVKEQAHGLLGQTWQIRKGKGINAIIEGQVDDYLIQEDDVFGETFVYNKFKLISSKE